MGSAEMPAVATPEVPKEPDPIKAQLKEYITQFKQRILNGKHERKSAFDPETVIEEAYQIINRNNHVSEILHSKEYEDIREQEIELIGDCKLRLGFCVDGRIPRFIFGRSISAWEIPGGVLTTQKRVSDGKLIPAAPDLAESVKDLADDGTDLLEVFFAHYDSTKTPEHGCSANERYLRELRANTHISADDMVAIKNEATKSPEDANLLLIDNTSVEAVTNLYNTEAKLKGKNTLSRVCISALYDTTTMGVVLKTNSQELSSTKISNDMAESIEQTTKIQFGKYRDNFNDPEQLPNFFGDSLTVTKYLLGNPEFKKITDSFIDSNYADLTHHQKIGLPFLIAKSAANQHLTGFSQVLDGEATHPFANHQESALSISLRGDYVGQYDTKQLFCSNAASSESAVAQLNLELGVMDKLGSSIDKPRLVFICSSVDREDFDSKNTNFNRAKANNYAFFRDVLADEDLQTRIINGTLIPITVLIRDDDKEVVYIPNNASQL